jgi:hypothetical protein
MRVTRIGSFRKTRSPSFRSSRGSESSFQTLRGKVGTTPTWVRPPAIGAEGVELLGRFPRGQRPRLDIEDGANDDERNELRERYRWEVVGPNPL